MAIEYFSVSPPLSLSVHGKSIKIKLTIRKKKSYYMNKWLRREKMNLQLRAFTHKLPIDQLVHISTLTLMSVIGARFKWCD